MIKNGELMPAVEAKEDPDGIPELIEWIEEDDEQIILHVNYSINHHRIERQVILSNDKDSFVLLLRYTSHFLSC